MKTFMIETPDDLLYPENCTTMLAEVLESDIEGAYYWQGMEIGTGIDWYFAIGRTGHFSRLTENAWMLKINPKEKTE